MPSMIPDWLIESADLDQVGQPIAALDKVFDNFDRMLTAGLYSEVDQILSELSVEGMSLGLLMGVLSITLPASGHLPSRPAYFDHVYQLCNRLGRDAEDLIGGLREWSGADGSGLLNCAPIAS